MTNNRPKKVYCILSINELREALRAARNRRGATTVVMHAELSEEEYDSAEGRAQVAHAVFRRVGQ